MLLGLTLSLPGVLGLGQSLVRIVMPELRMGLRVLLLQTMRVMLRMLRMLLLRIMRLRLRLELQCLLLRHLLLVLHLLLPAHPHPCCSHSPTRAAHASCAGGVRRAGLRPSAKAVRADAVACRRPWSTRCVLILTLVVLRGGRPLGMRRAGARGGARRHAAHSAHTLHPHVRVHGHWVYTHPLHRVRVHGHIAHVGIGVGRDVRRRHHPHPVGRARGRRWALAVERLLGLLPPLPLLLMVLLRVLGMLLLGVLTVLRMLGIVLIMLLLRVLGMRLPLLVLRLQQLRHRLLLLLLVRVALLPASHPTLSLPHPRTGMLLLVLLVLHLRGHHLRLEHLLLLGRQRVIVRLDLLAREAAHAWRTLALLWLRLHGLRLLWLGGLRLLVRLWLVAVHHAGVEAVPELAVGAILRLLGAARVLALARGAEGREERGVDGGHLRLQWLLLVVWLGIPLLGKVVHGVPWRVLYWSSGL